jgi:hypothetical protein
VTNSPPHPGDPGFDPGFDAESFGSGASASRSDIPSPNGTEAVADGSSSTVLVPSQGASIESAHLDQDSTATHLDDVIGLLAEDLEAQDHEAGRLSAQDMPTVDN